MQNIRNFCIIAHIDHGKSTLADRMLQITNTVTQREWKHDQLLDTMDLEQERGITIKLQPVRMEYKNFVLNLIDTPGHVDFTYEVNRSLAACEGALLVIDASQGIQAQTLANLYMAVEQGLKVIPVVNKIDLPAADIKKISHEIEHILRIDKKSIFFISAKTGEGVKELLDALVEKIPPPDEGMLAKRCIGNNKALKALVFDSVYDSYRGVIAYVRIVCGSVKAGDSVLFFGTKIKGEIQEVGVFKPKYKKSEKLNEGEVGYVITGFKNISYVRVGDTVCSPDENNPLPGYKKISPYVYASIFCIDGNKYPILREALEKLSLNDSSFSFDPEKSSSLGFGFRCGFLGLLHMEIVKERLQREYGLGLVVTAPNVLYEVKRTDNTVLKISNPSELPNRENILEIKEPWVNLEIICKTVNIGPIIETVKYRRGNYKNMKYLDSDRVLLNFEAPLSSIIIDFYDKLKGITSGYGSMSYTIEGYRTEKLIKLDILIAGEKIDPLSLIVHASESYRVGASITKKLKEVIPRAQFAIAVQASVNGKIVARETVSAYRKDVTAKLYGGDRTRKDKLLKKQKKGKKKMKQIGKISIPQEAFMAVLKR